MVPKVSIIILNWNGLEDTIECLESLKHITYSNYEILLVDNGSTDGSVECFRERYPEMEIIENRENLGFAEGNNVGIRRAMDARADYVLLLNNDTVVDPEFLGELVKVARSDKRIGVVGPKIYYYNYAGRKDVVWSLGIKTNYKCLFLAKSIAEGKIDVGQFDRTKKVDGLVGCAMLIKREVIESIGFFDVEYFVYGEEEDFCIRVRKNRWNIFCAAKSKIWHKVGGSSGGGFNKLIAYYKVRNKILLMRKNFSCLYGVTFVPYLLIFISFHTILAIYERRFNVISAMFKGILWHFGANKRGFDEKNRLCG
jgi:GT2 family glycosyltransferase